MLSLIRHCRSSSILPQVRQLFVKPSRNCTRNGGLYRSYTNTVWRREPIRNNFKLSNFMKNNTIAVRLCSNIPSKAKKTVGYWLLSCGGMVFVAVVLGGVTRLTESGLSMVTWRLLGEKMPITEHEWQVEFKKYQEYPEFKLKNSQMTLNEFKWIWYMEFAHRMWGRAIGGVFLVPAVYFWATGRFNKAMKTRILIFGGLIAAQGLMGWYMVKSGLEDRFHKQTDVPRVSQYRLASHLGLALLLYTGFLWSSLDYLLPAEELKYSCQKLLRNAKKFKGMVHGCKALVFLTALSGAFVAGLDAGLVYNSFPKMADKWIPDDILAFTPQLSNFTENPTTVQFDHRILGTSTLVYITILYLLSRKRVLPKRAYTAASVVATIAWLQVGLGISTLLTYVPTSLAACHQSGSLALLSAAIWLSHELKKLPK